MICFLDCFSRIDFQGFNKDAVRTALERKAQHWKYNQSTERTIDKSVEEYGKETFKTSSDGILDILYAMTNKRISKTLLVNAVRRYVESNNTGTAETNTNLGTIKYHRAAFITNKNFDKFEELFVLWMFSEIYRL